MEEVNQRMRPNRELNLKGEVCPYTFVRSKLAIEEMKAGEILQVIVDYEPATKNVPSSMENEGNEILGVSKLNESDWEILVRKGS